MYYVFVHMSPRDVIIAEANTHTIPATYGTERRPDHRRARSIGNIIHSESVLRVHAGEFQKLVQIYITWRYAHFCGFDSFESNFLDTIEIHLKGCFWPTVGTYTYTL